MSQMHPTPLTTPALSAEEFDGLVVPLKARVKELGDAIAARDERIRELENLLPPHDNSHHPAYPVSPQRPAHADTDREVRDEPGFANMEMHASDSTWRDFLPVKATRVVVLLDGDGAIFTDELLDRGVHGGLQAARRLSEGIDRDLRTTREGGGVQVWVFGFLNMHGLAGALGRTHVIKAKKLEDFVLGFNKSNERFIMLDVGSSKDAADTKIRALLEDETRMLSTIRVYFAGCHDDGYTAKLRTLITEGYKSKLVLLQTYSEMAKEVSTLGLRCLTIPSLFRPNKIENPVFSPKSGRVTKRTLSPRDSTSTSPQYAYASVPDSPKSPEAMTRSPPLPSLLLALNQLPDTQENAGSPERGNNPTSSSDSLHRRSASDGALMASRRTHGTLRLDPDKLLEEHDPAPCWRIILLGRCKYDTCKLSHDYDVSLEDVARIRAQKKATPCSRILQGSRCAYGNRCLYGHVCPDGPTCVPYLRGMCPFHADIFHLLNEED